MSISCSSNSSLYTPLENCSSESVFVLTALFVICILFLLPLFIFVLHLGYQRWRKQRSSFTAATSSHTDIFTFNMASLELLSIFGTCLFCSGTYSDQLKIMKVGLYVLAMASPAQSLFHLLTCVDRYLAVIYPVTYLGLRKTSRVRIRNVIIGCVWLFVILSPGSILIDNIYMIMNISLLAFSSVIAFFCSISVLCVLIHPGPGEVGRNKETVDQSKRRAFFTIMIITGALFIRFLSILVFSILLVSSEISYDDYCSALSTSIWFSLPSSLVLPLLFLHKAGKLPK